MKKLLPFLLAAVILISAISLSGFPEPDCPSVGFVSLFGVPARAAKIVDSGTCGAEGDGGNLTWTLDSDGKLTVSGSGPMADYDHRYDDDAPWYAARSSVRSLTIRPGVTSIGDYAFVSCPVDEITIPDSVTRIGTDAFMFCKASSVAIGSGVTAIEEDAFWCCEKLHAVTIPDSVTVIGDAAFYGCDVLASVTFGSGLTRIGEFAFQSCQKLAAVTVPDNVTSIGRFAFFDTGWYNAQPDGPVYAGSFFYRYKGTAPENTTVVIRDGTKRIADFAFSDCAGLTSVRIPDSMVSIGRYAFQGCKGLKSVSIPASVSMIADQPETPVFIRERKPLDYTGVDNAALVTVTPTALTYDANTRYSRFARTDWHDPLTLTDADGSVYALGGLYGETVYLLKKGGKNVVSYTCEGFTCGAGVIGDDNCLYLLWAQDGSDELYETAPKTENVKVIKYDLRGGRIAVCGFSIGKTRSRLPYHAGNAALAYQDGKLLVLWNTEWTVHTDGLHHQGLEMAVVDTADMRVDSLEQNAGSHSFGVSAIPSKRGFAYVQLNDVSRGMNLTEYDTAADDYSSVRAFSAPGQYGNNAKKLDGNATYVSGIGVAQSATTFAACCYGTDVYTSDVFYTSPLYETAAYDVYVRILDDSLHQDNASDCAGTDRIDEATGKVKDKNVVRITDLKGKAEAKEVKIVTLSCGAYCVMWNQYEKNVEDYGTLHYAVLDEKGNILKPDTVIPGVNLSDYNAPPVVQGSDLIWAVFDTAGTVFDTDTVTWITVSLEKDTHKWGKGKTLYPPTCAKEGMIVYRCADCGAQTVKPIPITEDHTWSISSKRLSGETEPGEVRYRCIVCLRGKTEEIPTSVLDVGMCGEKLTYTLTKDGKLTVSGTGNMNSAPWQQYRDVIVSAFLPEGLTGICDSAFARCTGLTGSLTIPGTVTKIGKSAFTGCEGLTGPLMIPDGVTELGAFAFAGCTRLTGPLTIPGGVTEIGDSTFAGCAGLDGPLTLPEGIGRIGSSAFSGCVGLTGPLTIPDGVTEIGAQAFSNCIGLDGPLTIPGSVTDVGQYAFICCSGLNGPLTIPDGVRTIGGYAFYGCTGFTGALTVPGSVTNIGESAFYGCYGLSRAVISANPSLTVSGSPFPFCDGLTTAVFRSGTVSVERFFASCKNLTEVVIPSTVTAVGDNAFLNDKSISAVYYEGTRADWEKVKIGDGNAPLSDAEIVCFSDTDTETDEQTGHRWLAAKTSVPATCREEGSKEFLCVLCGDRKTETLPKTDEHVWDGGRITKEAVCGEAGVRTFTCSVCGAVKTEKITATNEHQWDAGRVTKPATAEAEGVRTYTCTVCGKTRTEPIAKLEPSAPGYAPGDVDGDGAITPADARLARRASVGLEPEITEGTAAYLASDADGDGTITPADARLILRASVGLEDASKFGKRQIRT